VNLPQPRQHLRGRSVLALKDFTAREISYLLGLAAELKRERSEGNEVQRLKNKSIALIFEKNSTRTRIGFEIAAHEQGAQVTYLGPTGTQIGKKESMKDTARVLGRLYHGIEYRGFEQRAVEQLAQYSGVPVFNGLTDEFHPTQVLADLLTMQEHSSKPMNELKICYVGDANNNMGHSLMLGCTMMGMDTRICAPRLCQPDVTNTQLAHSLAAQSGGSLLVTDSISQAVSGCDFIYTDVWLSMGEPEEKWAERIELLLPYQVNQALLKQSGNDDIKFMHCLPAFHNCETAIGEKINSTFGLDAMEVTDDVFESSHSIVFDQAENRMHTIKAILVASMAETDTQLSTHPPRRA